MSLADFGVVNFSNCSVTLNSEIGSINSICGAWAFPIQMGINTVEAQTYDSLSPDGTSFSVAFIKTITAGAVPLGAVEGTPVSVPVAKIFSVATSPNPSPTWSITSVTSPTANGATVALTAGGTMLTYTPAANYVGADTINYVLSDGSQTAAGTVAVTVASGNAPSQNGLTIQMSGNNAILQFHGIPGQVYYVQQSSSVNGPWQDLPGTPVTANSLGLIAYTVIAPSTPSYYRTSTTP